MKLSIILPVLDEAAGIRAALERLQPLRMHGHQVIVADGGSSDDTPALASGLADHVISTTRGRASQMNAAVPHAHGDVLLFLHADTRLPDDGLRQIEDACVGNALAWGRFDVRIDGAHPMLKVVARMMNLRSRLTSVCTGDQCIFVRRELFLQVGGYPPIALMEDVALSKRLRAHAHALALPGPVVTAGRRWEKHGVWRTIMLMWWVRLRYFLGDSPQRLRRIYEGESQ